jgi:hypothetical protein
MYPTQDMPDLRTRLWAESDKCYWCGGQMILWQGQPGGELPPMAATLDHVRSRRSPARLLTDGAPPEIKVLACSRCNNLRAKYECMFYDALERAMRKDELQNAFVRAMTP